jgi:hypothetical protein
VKKLFLAATAIFLVGATCSQIPEDRGSSLAAVAGQSTAVFGGCSANFHLGWGNCMLPRGVSEFPKLKLVFTNPGSYAISDCELGIYKTGAVSAAGIEEVDLAGLKIQAEKNGLCVIKIEMTERYPDPRDKSQIHSLFLRGGFFLEMIAPGYLPSPPNSAIAFCVKVMRTTRGRTRVEKCKPD